MTFIFEYFITISLLVSVSSADSESPGTTAELITSLSERIFHLEERMTQVEEAKQVSSVHHCCPNGWLYYNNTCYIFKRDVKCSYIDAKAYCRLFDSNMLQIETEAENVFIKNYLRDVKDSYYWIGLTDINIESVWRWDILDNAPSFTDWHRGQPNQSGNQDCVALFPSDDYEWFDVSCDGNRATACEKPLN